MTLLLCALAFTAMRSGAATIVGQPGDGRPDFIYNPVDGDVRFSYDGGIAAGKLIQQIDLFSASGMLLPFTFTVDQAITQYYGPFRATVDSDFGNGFFRDGTDLGPLLPAHLSTAFLTTDVKLEFWIKRGGLKPGIADLVVLPSTPTVPLPSAGIAGLAFLGPSLLLMRVRRRSVVDGSSSWTRS